ncbi:MAG: hypothetical protein MUO63_03460 [Desulfobulbaceae bacterium]|nr:hypothetical protein [Desulfobulbaceae bacterium]
MKKIISTVAALGLVFGVAGAASALDFSMSGKYVVEGYMLNNADGSGFDAYDDEAGSDSGWLHTFTINPQLKVNDKITMFSELRFARYNVWGNQNGGDIAAEGVNSDIDVYLLYMEYLSPVGKFRVGRIPVIFGGDFLTSSTDSHVDRIMWWPSFVAEPFSLCLYTQKTTDNDFTDDNTDSDSDNYYADLVYKTDNVKLLGGYIYTNNKTGSDSGDPTTSYDQQNQTLRAWGKAKIGMVDLEGEWDWRFGDWRDYDDNSVNEDTDVDAMALMLDASATMDKLDVGLMYFWAEGQSDTDADADMEAAMDNGVLINRGLGDDFNPYYILTGDLSGMLNSDVFAADQNMVNSGVQCIGLHSDFQVSDQLTLHGAIGYAWADDTAVVELLVPSVGDEYGWEVDLGAKYKLLDNLTYEVRAAYFNSGDFFDDIATAVGQDSDDLYLLSHHLTMTF